MRASWRLLVVFLLAVKVAVLPGYCNNTCIPNEYRYKDICCPECPPGHRVIMHCTMDSATNCEVCGSGTYQAGSKECINCTICGEGAAELKPCSSTLDRVCNCTAGHYCANITKNGCVKCLKHRRCPVAEMVVSKGTYWKDTVCHPCAKGICSPEDLPQNVKIGIVNGSTAGNVMCQNAMIILSVIVAFILCN